MFFQFSSIGSNHRKAGVENQDALAAMEDDQYSIVALADGVSSCRRAREGAQAACDAAVSLLYGKPEFFLCSAPETTVRVVLNVIREKLTSMTSDGDFRPLSSTLAFVLLHKGTQRALLFQLGDGLVAGNRNGRWVNLIQPDDSRDGTCVTTTTGAAHRCRAVHMDTAQWDSFILLTDGAWRALTHHGRIRGTVAEAYVHGEYELLAHALQDTSIEDDQSFVIIKAS